jgi:hypothetical protein
MNKDIASMTIVASLRSCNELQELLPYIKDNCSDIEYSHLKIAIAKTIYNIMEDIVAFAGAQNPQVRSEVEARVEKYGRAF